MAKKFASSMVKVIMSKLYNINQSAKLLAANPSLFNQIITINNTRSNVKSKIGSNTDLEVDFEEKLEPNLLSALLDTKAKAKMQSKQVKK